MLLCLKFLCYIFLPNKALIFRTYGTALKLY